MKKSLQPLIYPFVIFSVLVTVVLQLAWLQQLYQSQKIRVKEQLERTVRDAAQRHMYLSVQKNVHPSASFKSFFNSVEWFELRQSFDDMHVQSLHSDFRYGFMDDSVKLSMSFSFPVNPGNRPPKKARGAFNKESKRELKTIEETSIGAINKDLDSALKAIPLKNSSSYRIYDYTDNSLVYGPKPDKIRKDFVSKAYSYNLKHLHKYQFLVPDIGFTVLYSMRYYLISSLMMMLLTIGAFYALLHMLRNQRLYADARQAFTSNMTHELKTPVATVSVALESIEKYGLINDPDKLKNYLEISKHELQRLNLLIEKVLSLDGGNEAPLVGHAELFDVQQTLAEVVAVMKLQFMEKGGAINFDTSTEPCFIVGDPLELSHAFYNLMDNALKYSGKVPVLDVHCCLDKQHVVLSFKDHGGGIPSMYQDKVFDRFFRVPTTGDTHDVKGSGLGLNYVYEIVQKHFGTVQLKNEGGNGCMFIINLPVNES